MSSSWLSRSPFTDEGTGFIWKMTHRERMSSGTAVFRPAMTAIV